MTSHSISSWPTTSRNDVLGCSCRLAGSGTATRVGPQPVRLAARKLELVGFNSRLYGGAVYRYRNDAAAGTACRGYLRSTIPLPDYTMAASRIDALVRYPESLQHPYSDGVPMIPRLTRSTARDDHACAEWVAQDCLLSGLLMPLGLRR